jgi:hypothetical protein
MYSDLRHLQRFHWGFVFVQAVGRVTCEDCYSGEVIGPELSSEVHPSANLQQTCSEYNRFAENKEDKPFI